MGDVVSGVGAAIGIADSLFGEDPDYVGDSVAANRVALAEAMEKGRLISDEQYARNKQAAYDTAALNRFNQITPYSSLTWYNTNDPAEAKSLAEQQRLYDMAERVFNNSNGESADYGFALANQFLNGTPEQQRAAMNTMHNTGALQQAAQNYTPSGYELTAQFGGTPAEQMALYKQATQATQGSQGQAMNNYLQNNTLAPYIAPNLSAQREAADYAANQALEQQQQGRGA